MLVLINKLIYLNLVIPRSNSSWNQTFEITSSNTSETSNETYIGLTGADFAADPYQRYAPCFISRSNG